MSANPLTITLDLEDHYLGGDPTRRYQANCVAVLDFFRAHRIRATIFVVGDIVADCHDLLARASADGHELALHSATHTPLTQENHRALKQPLADAKHALEDICGAAVLGFRAPVFSLNASSVWITDLLAELAFEYSSSVLPAAHPLYGFADAPQTPFRWPSGIVELPVPLATVLGQRIPFLGGIYLRYLPMRAIKHWAMHQDSDVVLWSYIHPYDIDHKETWYRFPGTSAWQSLLLWRRRRHTLTRLRALLSDNAPTLGEVVADLDITALPLWSPHRQATTDEVVVDGDGADEIARSPRSGS